MRTFNNDPNFSLVMPGGCNADCEFCFNKHQPKFTSLGVGGYLQKLGLILNALPEQFYQISITGGEPLLSPYIDATLGFLTPFKEKFTNILLTTNGTNLLEKIEMVSCAVDHINISRHHYDEIENQKIFGGSYDISDEGLFRINDEYGKRGIDVSVNCVINNNTSLSFITSYIDWARSMGFYAIRFRKENGDITPTPVEDEFDSYKVVWEGTCPVCRTKLQRIRGIDVYWKSSTIEPSDTITKEIFELVYQPNGKIYKDWAGRKEVPVSIVTTKEETRRVREYSSSSSGSSCGGRSYGSRC